MKTAGAPSTLEWSAVDWRRVHQEVWRLQVRIAEAVRQGRDYDRLYLVTAGSANRPSECLSLVRGNSHAGFLEELGGR